MPLDSAHHTPTPAAKRGSKWPSLALALALHLGLGFLVFLGWRSHSIKSEDDAAPAQVGLWTAADIAHAVKAPETPKEQSKPKHEAKPQQAKFDKPVTPDEEADIHLGQKKPHKKHQATPIPTEAPKAKPKHKPTAKPTPDPRIEQEKQRQEKAKAEKLAKDKALEKERQEAINRALGQSKKPAQAGGSSPSAHNGMGKSAYKPSNDYLARVSAIIKRNTRFDANSIDGNPSVKIEIHISPDGTILGKPRIIKSSGNAAWDEAAAAGVERAERLPRDPSLGTAPPIMIIDRKPKD